VIHSGLLEGRKGSFAFDQQAAIGNITRTSSAPPLVREKFRSDCRFGQLLDRYRMILFVPSLILALIVLGWIAWIAFGPRSTAQPPIQLLSSFASSVPQDDAEPKGVADSDPTSDSDYERHVRNRIESHQLPLGTMAGGTVPFGSRSTQRESDLENGSSR
jgi:hypothetical protein